MTKANTIIAHSLIASKLSLSGNSVSAVGVHALAGFSIRAGHCQQTIFCDSIRRMITIKQKFQGPQGNIYPWREGSFDSLWDIVGLFDEALETVLMAEIGRSNELPEKPSQDKFFIQDLCEKLNDRHMLAEFDELCWKNGSFDSSEEEGQAEPGDLGLSIDTVTEIYEFYEEGKLIATHTAPKG